MIICKLTIQFKPYIHLISLNKGYKINDNILIELTTKSEEQKKKINKNDGDENNLLSKLDL
jgi:hypothetical protein